MTTLRPALLFLLAATPAVAQNPVPVAPTPQAVPAVPPPPETPEERIAKLRQKLDRLQRELEHIQEVDAAGGLPHRVKAFLEERERAVAEITGYAPPPAQPEKTGARLLGDAEKQQLAEDVMFTVDGLPVTHAEFEATCAHLKSFPHEEGEEALRKRAVLELVRVKAAQAAFAVTAKIARAKIEQAQRLLKEGKDFAELAQQLSDSPTAEQGGDLGAFGRDEGEFAITAAAFALKPGQVSDVVASEIGYHLIKVTGVEQGEGEGEDRVRASHIMVAYSSDQAEQAKVRMRVNSGKVDLAFANDDDRRYAPDVFR